ncbi:MAG: anti-sigma factor [bacterium]
MYRRYGAYGVYKRRRQRGALAIKLMIVTLGAVGAAGYFATQKTGAESNPQNTAIVSNVSAPPQTSVATDPEVRDTVEMKSVDGDKLTAKVTRQLTAKKSAVLVLGDLTAPGKGFYYEVWAVQSTPYRFISLGKMVQRTDNKYGLVFETEESLKGFNSVIITLEKEDADPAPGKQIMIGNF